MSTPVSTAVRAARGSTSRASGIARRLPLLAPLAAALLGRLAQFAVLFAITRSFHGHDGKALVLGFGLFSAFGILADSGAGNYLLAQQRGTLIRQRYELALRMQAVLTVFGCALAAGITALAAHGFGSTMPAIVLTALALSQMADGMSRAVRSPLLTSSRDLGYALPDLVQGSLKIAVSMAAVLTGMPLLLVLLPLLNGAVIGTTWQRVRALLPSGDRVPRSTYLRIAEIGLSGAATALYSQAPLFVASVALPLSAASVIALVYRFTQPLEIVPSTLAQQAIPRLVTRPERVTRFWVSFIACAIVAVPALLLAAPLLQHIFAVRFEPFTVFLVAAVTLLPKFGNYALVAELLAGGLARQRFVVAVCIGVFSCALAATLARLAGPSGVVLGALCAEIALTTTLWTLLLVRRRWARRS